MDCFIDTDDNLIINRKFARLAGMNCAAYWALMITILKQVRAKGKLNPETGEFKVDRKWVESEIGLPTEEQHHCDEILYRLGIVTNINPTNKDKLIVDSKRYYELIINSQLVPEEFLPKTVKMSRAERTASRSAGIKAGILNLFSETDEDLIAAYTDLIDVYYSKGICKHAEWKQIVELIETTTHGDKADKLNLVKFAIASNWRSFISIVDAYTKQRTPTGARLNKPQSTVTKINTEIKF